MKDTISFILIARICQSGAKYELNIYMSYNTLEINKLKSRANDLFMKIKFGSKNYYDALDLFKKKLEAKSEEEQIRTLKNIIYLLENS